MYRASGLFELSTLLLDARSEDDILRVVAKSVVEMSSCDFEAVYLRRNEHLVPWAVGPGSPRRRLADQVESLRGADGPVVPPSPGWGWAFALRHTTGHSGYLVVTSRAEPSGEELRLLEALARQAGVALGNVALHRRERQLADHLLRLNEESTAASERLTRKVSDLERERAIHDTFHGVSASGEGEQGIVRALHALTGLPAAAEDRFGNLRAWAGPGCPESYPKPSSGRRAEVLGEAARHGRAVREKDRLVALAQTRGEPLGVLVLVDPHRTASRHDIFALECGATMLALELAHLRNLAEVELRLRRDLVDDLLAGTDDESAYERSRAVGHDLHGPHHVAVVRWRVEIDDDLVRQAAERAAAGLGLAPLSSRRAGMVVLLTGGRPEGDALHRAVAEQLHADTGAIGIGGRCDRPAEFPRSFREATQALDIRLRSRVPNGVTFFDELGIFRVLDTGDGGGKIRRFVREWLGPLLDYDAQHHSDLVATLSRYLDCGGNYDSAAEALVIHRSTLRYRLQRIREIAGADLSDAETRLNLHVATRAWQVLNGRPGSDDHTT